MNMLSIMLTEAPLSRQENILVGLLCILFVFFLFWLWILLPAKMAKKRGRSRLGWVLLFWIISPFWGIIALLILGDSKKKIKEELIKEFSSKEQ